MSDNFFMKRLIISVMSLLRRIFFLEGFFGIRDFEKKQFLYDGVWTVVTYLPRLGPHSLRSRGTSS